MTVFIDMHPVVSIIFLSKKWDALGKSQRGQDIFLIHFRVIVSSFACSGAKY